MPRFPKGSKEAKDYMASVRGKRGGSCCGGSVISGNPSGPSGPPPPPPPPPSRPSLTPINTTTDPDQRLINDIEEILMSSSLPQARREQLMADLKRLKDRVSGNPQSGSGIIPIFKKPKGKVAPEKTYPDASTYTDPSTDPDFLALIAESERVMKEMKDKVEMLKKYEEKKSKMSGKGQGRSDKIVPMNTFVEPLAGDDRVGSTERMPMASAVASVASAPEATSYPVSQVTKRKKLKELERALKDRIKSKEATEQRMENNERFMFSTDNSARSRILDEDLLVRINEDIQNLTEQIDDLTNELEYGVVASVVGNGMKKQKN